MTKQNKEQSDKPKKKGHKQAKLLTGLALAAAAYGATKAYRAKQKSKAKKSKSVTK